MVIYFIIHFNKKLLVMARQVGHIKYKGTLGEVRHFKIKGMQGDFAGLKGGPSGDQVKTDPSFIRTRENMNEFGGCAAAAKSVRIGLSQLMKQMSDPQLTGRITGIMKKINLEDLSEARGVRAILISTQRKYLKGLNFNKNLVLESVLYAPFSVTPDVDRLSSDLVVPAFNIASSINIPSGATHFRLVNAVSVLSDYAFNASTKIYEPVESALNEISSITYSEYIDLSTVQTTDITVTSALPAGTTLTENVSVINSVGIEFYQKVGENYFIFKTGNCLKVYDLF